MFSANREPREPSKLGWLRPIPSLEGGGLGEGVARGGGVDLGGGGVKLPCDVTGVRAGPGLITATSLSEYRAGTSTGRDGPATDSPARPGDVGGDPGPTYIEDGTEPGPPCVTLCESR